MTTTNEQRDQQIRNFIHTVRDYGQNLERMASALLPVEQPKAPAPFIVGNKYRVTKIGNHRFNIGEIVTCRGTDGLCYSNRHIGTPKPDECEPVVEQAEAPEWPDVMGVGPQPSPATGEGIDEQIAKIIDGGGWSQYLDKAAKIRTLLAPVALRPMPSVDEALNLFSLEYRTKSARAAMAAVLELFSNTAAPHAKMWSASPAPIQ